MQRYRHIITHALRFSWTHRFLWIVAFLAALGGNGGEYELAFSGSDSLSGQTTTLGFLRSFFTDGSLAMYQQNVVAFFQRYAAQSAGVLVLLIGLFLAITWLITIAQAGLVWAIEKLENGAAASVGATLANGTRFFWPVFAVNLVSKVIFFGVLGLIAMPLGWAFVRTGTSSFYAAYVLIAFLAYIPLAVTLSFIVKYATAYIVLRGERWKAALGKAWRLFTNNWLVTLEVALLLFIINLVTSLLLFFTLVLLGLPTNPAGLLVFFLVLAVFGAYLATFQNTTWILLFRQLEQRQVRSKILRWFDKRLAQPATPRSSRTSAARTK